MGGVYFRGVILAFLLCMPALGFQLAGIPAVRLHRISQNALERDRSSYLQVGRGRGVLAMTVGLLKFGNKMDIRVRLPTRDRLLAEDFIKDPTVIIQSTYDSSKATRLSDTLWRIKFAEIPIPGIDTVSPELDMDFRYANGSIYMQSSQWALKGSKNSQILKDSKFIQSFNIKLQGELTLEYPGRALTSTSPAVAPADISGGLIVAVGFVDFQAQGERPSALQRAPAFVLDGTINFIQSLVTDFVSKKFSTKLLNSFTTFSSAQLVTKR